MAAMAVIWTRDSSAVSRIAAVASLGPFLMTSEHSLKRETSMPRTYHTRLARS